MANKPTKVVNPFEGAVVQVVSESAKTAQFSLPVDQIGIIDKALEGFFESDGLVFDAQEMARKSAGLIAKVLGATPTYAHWMGVRSVTIGRIMAQRANMSDDTAQKYWDRTICGYLDKEFSLTKPKSVSADAEKKRKQREAEAKKYESFTDSQLVEKAKECGIAMKFDEGKKYTAEIERRAKESNAGLVEECKVVRGEIVARLRGVLNLELLEEIRDMLPEVVIKAE
jgi:hypothetical protein